jgi:hypothetical protein
LPDEKHAPAIVDRHHDRGASVLDDRTLDFEAVWIERAIRGHMKNGCVYEFRGGN